jgi:hypothetical protein
LIAKETLLIRKETIFGRRRLYLCFQAKSNCSHETKATHTLAITPDRVVGDHGFFYNFPDVTASDPSKNNQII